MKKTILAFVFALAAVISANALDATVLSVKGKVEVQKGEEWVPVKAGDIISKGSVISTGFKSEAVIKVKESKFTLSPLTRITIEKLSSTKAKDNTQLYLDSGSVGFDVKKSENKKVGFKVRSPAATASVRGTSGLYRPDGALIVFSGLVTKGPAESPTAEPPKPKAKKASTEGAGTEEPKEGAVDDKKDESLNPEAAPEEGAPDTTEDTPEEYDPEDDEFVPEDGESKATTNTQDVSGTYGTPVFAGQSSTTDPVTGDQSSPQSEKNNESHGSTSSTNSLSSEEAPSQGNTTTTTTDKSETPKYGSVNITISWD